MVLGICIAKKVVPCVTVSGLHGELSNWSGEEHGTLSGLNLLHGVLES